ncbi:MAG: 2-amino-4-hydroxy-6-hydroxymethyldihydropteridine diphosphokinase [Gammaproteobacteria bacterium]|nr:2-amino-4-hydroxy-6-hydroxymethyldihydropteridine diphosphokinase [Gammaproteobacteria bacterium]
MCVDVYISLGSNLNNPMHQLAHAFEALSELPGAELHTRSSYYRSAPIMASGVHEGQPDYINAAAVLNSDLPPLELLSSLQKIECRQGRQRVERWGPRTLDLDIILYGDIQSRDPVLTLPHPRFHERPFVLYPLYECAPNLILPDGVRLRELIQHCSADGLCIVRSPP